VAEHVAQGDLGQVLALDAEVLEDRPHVLLDAIDAAVAAEVVVAEVARGRWCPARIRPVRPPSSSGTRAMTPTSRRARTRRTLVLRSLLEDVVDDLTVSTTPVSMSATAFAGCCR
jgi:hypothetical protein